MIRSVHTPTYRPKSCPALQMCPQDQLRIFPFWSYFDLERASKPPAESSAPSGNLKGRFEYLAVHHHPVSSEVL